MGISCEAVSNNMLNNYTQIVLCTVVGLIGTLVGRVVNVLAEFIPARLLPVMLYVRGCRWDWWRCRLVEVLCGGIAVWVVAWLGCTVVAVLYIVLLWVLVLLARVDSSHYLLPDCVTLPLLWLGLCVNAYGVFVSAGDAIIGAGVGYLVLRGVGAVFKWLRGMDGMGRGDCKLFAALGAWFGSYPLLAIMVIAASLGSVVGLVWIGVKKQSWDKPLPFGVFLALATWMYVIVVIM